MSWSYITHYSFDYAQQVSHIHYPSICPMLITPCRFTSHHNTTHIWCVLWGHSQTSMCTLMMHKHCSIFKSRWILGWRELWYGKEWEYSSQLSRPLLPHMETRREEGADNCVGQNFVLQVSNLYLLLTRHYWFVVFIAVSDVEGYCRRDNSFVPPSWPHEVRCFGLMKKKFWYSVVNSLDNL